MVRLSMARPRHLRALGVVAVAASTLGLAWFAQQSAELREIDAPLIKDRLAAVEPTTTPMSALPYGAFATSESASQALEAAGRIPDERIHDRVDARTYLAGVCAPVAGSPPDINASWLAQDIARYCVDYDDPLFTGATSEELIEMQAHGARAHIEIIAARAGKSEEVQADALQKVAEGSDSPWEVHAALQIASERYAPLPSLSALGIANLIERRDVLAAASELEYCRLAGDCGPRSIAVLRACLMLSHCDPGASMTDLLREHYSPRVFRMARELSLVLARARSRSSPAWSQVAEP